MWVRWLQDFKVAPVSGMLYGGGAFAARDLAGDVCQATAEKQARVKSNDLRGTMGGMLPAAHRL
jgi:hypothetical protein